MELLETSSMRQADSDSELDSESLSARDRGRQHLRQAFSSIELTLTRSLWTLSMLTQSDPDSVFSRPYSDFYRILQMLQRWYTFQYSD